MLFDLLSLTPYIAIAASLLVLGIAAALFMHFGEEAPKPTGFYVSRDRRRVTYRGFVELDRRNKLQEGKRQAGADQPA